MTVYQNSCLPGPGAGTDEQRGWSLHCLLLSILCPSAAIGDGVHGRPPSTSAIHRIAAAKCSGTTKPSGFVLSRSASR